jgi:multiple sugar transport system permease protein
MPLISTVGRRSPGVRLLILALYAVLTLGAVSMAYPFLLMLSSATAGRGDCQEFRLIPRYWVSDAALFRKYLFDTIPMDRPAWRPTDAVPSVNLATWFGRDDWFAPRDVAEDHLAPIMALPAAPRVAMAADLRDFIAGVCPAEFRMPAGLFDADSALALQPRYRAWLRQRYGAVEAANRAYLDSAAAWEDFAPVIENFQRTAGTTPRERDWRAFLSGLPPPRVALFDAHQSVYEFLRSRELPASYRGACDRAGNVLRSRIPFEALDSGALGSALKDDYYRRVAPLRFVRLDVELAEAAWRRFLTARQAAPGAALTSRMPPDAGAAGLWSLFVQRDCPLEALHLVRPEDFWQPFLRQRYPSLAALNAAWGATYAAWDEVRLPWAAFKYDGFLREKDGLRGRYIRHNFATVFAFIAIHGQALRVTLIYILLSVVSALTVNPLAAYAMSRFRLKESHHILVFLLATMAFPGEVLMIPNFLLIKSFPYLQILTVLACLALFFLVARVLGRRLPLLLAATVGLALVAAVAGWVVPHTARRLGMADSISLMNTFWALVLPGLANGYGIFLLKGFFDSLPPELYEAGLIDGASELRMFWRITLPMSKPILAVIALGAFSGAYGAFMHAFLICQDPKMWTLMVFLYEFQQMHTVPLVMASLVVAAIPTLLVFVFCQNVILRGIVIPTFK